MKMWYMFAQKSHAAFSGIDLCQNYSLWKVEIALCYLELSVPFSFSLKTGGEDYK